MKIKNAQSGAAIAVKVTPNARQDQITRELLDIVGGAEVMQTA